jgi:signal transduction histidine kinase
MNSSVNSVNVELTGTPPQQQPDMNVQVEDPVQEVKRLQRCISDLVSLLALPAVWSGNDPSQIIQLLLDALLRMLNLDFICVRLKAPVDVGLKQILRVSDTCRLRIQPEDISRALNIWFEVDGQKSHKAIRHRFGDEDIAIFPVPLGVHGESGMILVGSDRANFPGQTDSLLLSVAANQASIGLREAQVIAEQRRIAVELDRRVAERTAELATANEELKKEIVERKLAEERLSHEELELKRSEEALARTRSELTKVASITSLGVLTASIAHEINQPLSGIVTNASTGLRMLSADPPNIDGAMETVRRTLRDGNRASDVITRLRTLYSKKEPSLESMDLNEATREVIALSLSELQRSGVTLRYELADNLPPVTGDRVQLQQVILNLLRNAADAMGTIDDRPREMFVRLQRDQENHVRLSVTDGGVGFTTETAGRIFEAFYTTKADGMGIGLSISRSIIEAHQGRLWATPNNGPGATVSFVIPSALEDVPEAEAKVIRSEPSTDAA